jgi:hypothetical protein
MMLSCWVVAIDWGRVDKLRKSNDPQLSSWLGWHSLSSIPAAEVFFRLLFRPNAASLPDRTRWAVLRIRVANVTLILGVIGWLSVYYLEKGSIW